MNEATATSQPARLKLYEIPHAIREIEADIIEAGGEFTEDTEARLNALEEAFDTKVEYIALLVREAKAEEVAVQEEESRLSARRKAAQNRQDRLKSYLHECLKTAGIERVDGLRVKVRVQDNSRPSITWTGSEDEIPEPYRRVTVSVDGVRAYEDHKAGAGLPEGFRVEFGRHLRIW